MALVYFDSSALVKLVVDEEGTDVAAALWDGCDSALSSRLAHPEVCAALAAAHRNHDLTTRHYHTALDAWHTFWAAVRPIELTEHIQQHGGELASTHALRGADAIHLASALALDTDDLIVAVWDKRLHRGAWATGLHTAPGSLR